MWRRAQSGSTALILAAGSGHADCARLLLDAGADKEATDKVRASGGVCGAVALMRVVMELTGCYLNKFVIFTFDFSFHFRPFHVIVFAI